MDQYALALEAEKQVNWLKALSFYQVEDHAKMPLHELDGQNCSVLDDFMHHWALRVITISYNSLSFV